MNVIFYDILQEVVCGWLETSLKSLQQNNNLGQGSGSVTVTQDQLADFHQAVTSAESAPDISHAIREFVRLWR